MFNFIANLWNNIVSKKPQVVIEEVKPSPAPSLNKTKTLGEIRDDLLFYHNQARRYDLALDEELNNYAQKHAERMVQNGLVHSTLIGIKRPHYSAAENIAWGQRTAGQVMTNWLNSKDGHRETLLSSRYRYVGFGCARDEFGNFYWCAVFTD